MNETASFRSSLQWVHDYEIVLKKGFLGIKKDAEDHLAELDEYSPTDNMEKKPFWESVKIVCDAIILWADRHGDLAEKLAETEADDTRKKELLKLAEICHHVPAYPARNFYEAMQAQWFTQMFSRIEQKTETIISNGRMDQYLCPFYKKDIEKFTSHVPLGKVVGATPNGRKAWTPLSDGSSASQGAEHELLPYHTFGKGKYKMLGREYEMEAVK